MLAEEATEESYVSKKAESEIFLSFLYCPCRRTAKEKHTHYG